MTRIHLGVVLVIGAVFYGFYNALDLIAHYNTWDGITEPGVIAPLLKTLLSPLAGIIGAWLLPQLGTKENSMAFSWSTFVNIAKLVAPAALAASGVPPALIPVVVHGIAIAEQCPATGPEKKALVLDAVATAVAGINAVKPGAVSETWPAVVGMGIDATVGAVNAIKHEGVVPPAI